MRLRTLVAACVCAAFSVGFAIEACASAFDEDGGVLSPLPTADPTSPDVDETTLVAIPKMSVSRDAMESVLRGVSRSARLGLRSATRGTRFALVETDGRTSPDLARTMADSGLFEVVDYSVRYHPAYGTNPNDPHFVSQWPLKFEPGANFASIWPALASMPGGDAAPVAVIDVGCYLNHPDRGSNMVGGFDFGQNRVDVTPSRPDLAGSWHGSQVASIIGSATDNGKGIAGAGWDTKVICYKASDGNGELNTLAVATSIQDSAVRGVKVVNISLTSDQKDSTLQYSIDMVLKQGVVVVAAAGNNGAPTPIAPGATPNAPNYPASFPGVLAVGATDPTGARAPFSNTNPETHIDLVAPGVGIHGWCQPGYCELDGTSFAAPFVSAAAALVMRARPGLSAAAVGDILTSTARGSGSWKPDVGWGLLDANAAVSLAQGAPAPPWFAPPHDGVFAVEPGKLFTAVLGIGGQPLPTAQVAAGSSLPGGVTLVNLPGIGWSLRGTIATPGSYSVRITALQGSGVLGTKTITLHVGAVGRVTVTANLESAEITAGEAALVHLFATTVEPVARPSGWCEVRDETAGRVVARGTWGVGQTTLVALGLPAGTREISATIFGNGTDGPWQRGPVSLGSLSVVPAQGPHPSTSLARSRITTISNGALTFRSASVVPGMAGRIEVVHAKSGKVVGAGAFAPNGKVKVTLRRLAAGTHALRVRVLAGGADITVSGGSLTVVKVKPTLKVKIRKGRLTATVKAKGIKPVKGKVAVKAAGKTRVATLKKGRVRVRLPQGATRVKVTYRGSKLCAKRTTTRSVPA